MTSQQKQRNAPTAMSAALSLATNHGWPVFPVYERTSAGRCSCGKVDCHSPGKHPRTADGFKSATKDPNKIRELWSRWPNANIGVATGRTSGIFVVDIDPKNKGNESLKLLVKTHGQIPATVKSLTGGDGRHFFFNHPGGEVSNKTNLRPGIDIRGDGGYIVVPPSNHISGGKYKWDELKAPGQIALCDAPGWILAMLNEPKKGRTESQENPEVFLEGRRNATLTSLAGSMRVRGLSADIILTTLIEINKSACKPPLSDHEVQSIIQSISKYPVQSAAPLIWEEMRDLPDVTLRAPILDEKMIPKPLRKWVLDLSERMQVPPDFIAPMALVVASTVIGRQLGIRPKKKDSFTVIPNLWGALIAPPSTLKTPAIIEAMSPLYSLADQAAKQFKEDDEKAKWEVYCTESEIKILEKQMGRSNGDRDFIFNQIKELKNKLSEIQPKERRYISNDSTIEQLAVLMSENQNGLLVYRDELTGFLNMMEKQGHENDRAFYLEAWSGNGRYKVDRITRSSLAVNGMRLSVLGGIQPARIKQYIYEVTSGSSGNDGFVQRFQMLVYPDQKKNWTLVDREPNRSAKDHVNSVFSVLADLDLDDIAPFDENKNSIPYLRFDDKAQELYYQWITNLEKRLEQPDQDSEALRTHLGKYRSLMPALALIFHLLSYAENKFSGNLISRWAAKMAIEWCVYLEAHAKKVYGLLGEIQVDSANAFIKKVADGKIRDGDSLRDIYRHHWSNLDSSKKVESATSMLREYGWCQTQNFLSGGAPSEVVRLNPKWLESLKTDPAKTAKSSNSSSFGSSGTTSAEQFQ